jgi:hypothetical protein
LTNARLENPPRNFLYHLTGIFNCSFYTAKQEKIKMQNEHCNALRRGEIISKLGTKVELLH